MVKKILSVLILCSAGIAFAGDDTSKDWKVLMQPDQFRQAMACSAAMKTLAAEYVPDATFTSWVEKAPDHKIIKSGTTVSNFYEYVPYIGAGIQYEVDGQKEKRTDAFKTIWGRSTLVTNFPAASTEDGFDLAGDYDQCIIRTFGLTDDRGVPLVYLYPGTYAITSLNNVVSSTVKKPTKASIEPNVPESAPFAAAWTKLKKEIVGGGKKDADESKDDGKQMVHSASSSKLRRKSSEASPKQSSKAGAKGDSKTESSGFCVAQ